MEPTILVCVINSFASYNQFTHCLQSELFLWCKNITTVLFIIPSKNQGSQFRKLKAWLYNTIKKKSSKFHWIWNNTKLTTGSLLPQKPFLSAMVFHLSNKKNYQPIQTFIPKANLTYPKQQYLMHLFLMHFTNNPPFSPTCMRCQVSAWTTKQQHLPSLYNQCCNRVQNSLKRVFNSQELWPRLHCTPSTTPSRVSGGKNQSSAQTNGQHWLASAGGIWSVGSMILGPCSWSRRGRKWCCSSRRRW